MVTAEEKAKFLLEQTSEMKRVEIITCLKRYRGWELAEIANCFGYSCKRNVAKAVALQMVFQHLLSYSEKCKIGV